MQLDGQTLLLVEEYFNELVKEQELAIFQENEYVANELWAKIQNYNIIQNYVMAYTKLKEQDYIEALSLLDKVDINIGIVASNCNLSDLFMLTFLRDMVPKYMKLFPYKYFISRESVVKSSECSICHKKFNLRNRCEHTIGKLYMGKLCVRIVTELSLLAIAIVENPADRYTVVQVNNIHYDYSYIEKLMKILISPFQFFDVDEEINGSNKHLSITVQSVPI